MKSCLIIGAAPCADPSYLKHLAETTGFVICADGGIDHAQRLGITPDVWIGDQDSAISQDFCSKTELLPREKDYTDLYCAAQYAVNNGFQMIIFGAVTGGRGDHFLANLFLLEHLADSHVSAEIVDEQNRYFLHCGGTMCLSCDDSYQYVSLLPLDKKIFGVTMQGLKYPLTGAVIERKNVISVSNEPISDEFIIQIERGTALVVLSRDVKK